MQKLTKHGTEYIEQHRNDWQEYYDAWFVNKVFQYWFDIGVQSCLTAWYWPVQILGVLSDDHSSNLCQPDPLKANNIQPSNIKLPPSL